MNALATLCPACLTELPDDYEGDHVRIDQAVAGNVVLFRRMTKPEQAEVINTALHRGQSWTSLSRRFMVSIDRLRAITGQPPDDFHQQVATLHALGLSDSSIATNLGVSSTKVNKSRAHQELPSNYGPGGRPINRNEVAA